MYVFYICNLLYILCIFVIVQYIDLDGFKEHNINNNCNVQLTVRMDLESSIVTKFLTNITAF